MTEQTGGFVLPRQGLSFGPWMTYVRALLSQSGTQLTTDTTAKPRCEFFIEVNRGTPRLRMTTIDDSLPLDDDVLTQMAGAINEGELDLVLGDEASIDLTFDVPPGLLPEVSQMIDAELLYRSPFAENATFSIWEAHENDTGGWCVNAALTLEQPVKDLVEKLKSHGLEIASIIRESNTVKLASIPPWTVESAPQKPSTLSLFRNLVPSLQAALVGVVLFALSATVFWGQATLRNWAIQSDASAAQSVLRETATAASRVRGLNDAVLRSTEVLALTGALSEILPDGVWLDQIVIDGLDVTLVGYAASAADVTRILTEDARLTDISFASPVIRDNSQSIERFRIAATLLVGDAQ